MREGLKRQDAVALVEEMPQPDILGGFGDRESKGSTENMT